MQQMWRAVGVQVDIQVVDSARLIKALGGHEFDAAVSRGVPSADPDLMIYPYVLSRLAERTPSTNLGQYANPKMDELLEAGRRELNPLERRKIYSRITDLLAKDLPFIFLGYTTSSLIFNPSVVKGMKPMPDGLIRVGEVWKE